MAVTSDMSEADAEQAEEASLFTQLDKPTIVYVCHSGGGGKDFEKLEEIVFKDEKVGLSVKAFRRVKIRPEKLESDPILAEEGKEVPRLLVVDPIREDVKVLEKGNLKASKFVKAMERAAKKFYEERLDKVVDEHLDILTEQDQLFNEQKVLKDKEARLQEDGKSAEKKLEKLRKEMAEVEEELKELKEKKEKLWKLTPRHEKASA